MPTYAIGDELPPHQPNCFGCGPRNTAGVHLRCHLTEDGVGGRFSLAHAHEGGPGLAHGGVVAAALDDLFGFLLYRTGSPMVTARLEIDYRRPIALEREYLAAARVESQQGRKVWCTGELLDADGTTVVAQARGLFLMVSFEHFLRASPDAMRSVEHWRRAGEEGGAGPGPVGP